MGEFWAQYMLAKNDVNTVKLSQELESIHNCDLISEYGLKIEIKTAIYKPENVTFNMLTQYKKKETHPIDFVICVLIDGRGVVDSSYIIPFQDITTTILSMKTSATYDWGYYCDRWELISLKEDDRRRGMF